MDLNDTLLQVEGSLVHFTHFFFLQRRRICGLQPLPATLQAKTSPSPAFNSRRVPRSIDGTGRRTSHRRSDYRLTELPVSCTLVPRAPSRLPPCLLRSRASSAFRRGILSALDRWGRSASSSSCSSSRAVVLAPDSQVIFLLLVVRSNRWLLLSRNGRPNRGC